MSWLLIVPLVYLSITDIQSRFLSDKVMYPLAVLAFLTAGIRDIGYVDSLVGGIVAFSVFCVLVFGPKTMAFGDAKLAGIVGLIVGIYGLIWALPIAFLTGTCYSAIRSYPNVPFAPFLTVGAVAGLIFPH